MENAWGRQPLLESCVQQLLHIFVVLILRCIARSHMENLSFPHIPSSPGALSSLGSCTYTSLVTFAWKNALEISFTMITSPLFAVAVMAMISLSASNGGGTRHQSGTIVWMLLIPLVNIDPSDRYWCFPNLLVTFRCGRLIVQLHLCARTLPLLLWLSSLVWDRVLLRTRRPMPSPIPHSRALRLSYISSSILVPRS